MRHSNPTLLDIGAIRSEAVEAARMIANGEPTADVLRMLETDTFGTCWYVDVPTHSRRRGESPVIPGSLYWR